MQNKFICLQLKILIIGLCFLLIQSPMVRADDAVPLSNQDQLQKDMVKEKTGGNYTLYGNLGGRVNPQGLGFSGGVKYRDVYQYSEKYDTPSAYWQTSLGVGVSPAYGQVSAHIEWMPWMFLAMRMQYNYYQFFGMNNSLLSFSSGRDPFGDDVTRDRHDEEHATGQRYMFQPTLQGKIGSFILRNQTDIAYYRFSGRGPYFLELEYYTLLKDGDYLISNRTQLLYEAWKGSGGRLLLAGPYYEVTRADEAQITQQKVGGLIYWVPMDSVLGVSRPRLAMMAGYHFEDPNRQGQFFFVLGMGFDFDL